VPRLRGLSLRRSCKIGKLSYTRTAADSMFFPPVSSFYLSRRFLLAPTSHRSSPSVNSTSDPDASARDPVSRRRLLSKLNRNLIDSRVMEVNSTNFRPHPPHLPARNARDREENFLDNDYSRRDEPRLIFFVHRRVSRISPRKVERRRNAPRSRHESA